MKHALPLFAVLLVPAFLAVQPAAAQDWRPSDGDRSIQFSLPSGGATGFGAWWFDDDGAFGLNLSLGAGAFWESGGVPDSRGTSISLGIGPRFKSYRATRGPVTPYTIYGFDIGGSWAKRTVELDRLRPVTDTRWSASLSGLMALGVDWFPTERLSIGGHAGFRAAYRYEPRGTGSGDTNPTRHTLQLGSAFTSALGLNFYF